MRGAWAAACLVALLAALTGCAVQTPRLLAAPPADLPPRVELTATPFFPQEDYQCGPAALATALSAAGIPTRPDALVDRVFLPGRQGSLQIEMLVGARGRGAVATRIPGTLEALMRETNDGNPVVVLQNLGLSWAPSWHYAVVIGYDLDAAHFVLRSGPLERQQLAFSTFEHTWDRSGRWAFVVTPPGALPTTASEAEVTRALVAFEHNAPPAAAARAYRSALARWPDNLTLAMGLGNTLYAQGETSGAAAVFRDAAQRHDDAAAYNNLAIVLLEQGRRDEARRAAQRAVSLGGPFQAQAADTLKRVDE
ncbi:PA2778 family cysteine peptidase [Denitromonas iodatirespirans]|uniref:PA2778 family cysteine peptidase n=1 Tax=Denitromonas iodatirespirans TaxID=2795389 RepID=A0A944DGY3_DENI1|nr:PA2778 family cysteine peptidase [Denitromonas iodatirespirans]MBT0964108.1 PA2778 family cysteine peptidase [Denitromonas iodatirespirans]